MDSHASRRLFFAVLIPKRQKQATLGRRVHPWQRSELFLKALEAEIKAEGRSIFLEQRAYHLYLCRARRFDHLQHCFAIPRSVARRAAAIALTSADSCMGPAGRVNSLSVGTPPSV